MYFIDVSGDPPQKPTLVVGFFMGVVFFMNELAVGS